MAVAHGTVAADAVKEDLAVAHGTVAADAVKEDLLAGERAPIECAHMSGAIVITGLGVVSVAGVGREAFARTLASGARTLDGATNGVLRIADFGAKAVIDPKALRRMARLTQLALVAGKQALAMSAPTAHADRSGIVLGTGLGALKETCDFLGGWIDSGAEGASPLLFPSSVMNAAAGQMAMELGWRGVNSTVNHREHSTLGALSLACDFLALGRADVILCGAVDEAGDAAAQGYRAFGALSPTGVRPFARDRDGTILGEGAAVFVLEREADARARGAQILARVAGFSSTGNDRPRIGWGMSDKMKEPARAISEALAAAGVPASSVDWIAASACGLPLDDLEAHTLAAAVPGRPLSAIAGQTAESMASGAQRIAAAVIALADQTIPGTLTSEKVEPSIAEALVRPSRSARVDTVLVPSISEGGANAALVLTR